MSFGDSTEGRRTILGNLSGVWVLVMLLVVLCVEPLGVESLEAHAYVSVRWVFLAVAVWVDTVWYLGLGLRALWRGMGFDRFGMLRLSAGVCGSFLYAGLLSGVIGPGVCWLCFLMALFIGVLGLVGLCSGGGARRQPALPRRNVARDSALIFLGSLLALVLFSALILMTPGASFSRLSFTDAFFMSASAASNTGLASVPVTECFSWLGLTMLALDMQLGAMGVMTLTYFVLLVIGRRLAMRDSLAMSSLMDEEDVGRIPALIRTVILVSVVIELAGAAALYWCWLGNPAVPQSPVCLAGYALFHSVSTFCNSGLTLFPAHVAEEGGVSAYVAEGVMMLLIAAGTLGFGVYLEMLRRLQRRLRGERNPLRWSTHAWFVLRVTIVLTVLGTVALTVLGSLEAGSRASGVLANGWDALWNCVGRSTGISRVDMDGYGSLYHICMMALMFIGGNPAGTGGGMFAPVFAICVLEVCRELRGERDVIVYHRRLARKTVQRAMCTLVLCLLWVLVSAVLLLALEPGVAARPRGLLDMVYLSVSAFGTSGYSLSDPAELGVASKYLLSLSMLFGRMGMFTTLLLFISPRQPAPISYPETRLPLT